MIKPYYICTMNWMHPVSLAIAMSTRGRFSHAAIGFEVDDKGMEEMGTFYGEMIPDDFLTELHKEPMLYFESHLKKDKRTGKTGTRGPYWFDHITGWAAEQPATRRWEATPLRGISEDETWMMFGKALAMVGKHGYDLLQIVFNFRGMFRAAGVPLNHRNKDKVTCTEYFSVTLPPAWAVDRLDLGYFLYEEYTPSGKCGIREKVRGSAA